MFENAISLIRRSPRSFGGKNGNSGDNGSSSNSTRKINVLTSFIFVFFSLSLSVYNFSWISTTMIDTWRRNDFLGPIYFMELERDTCVKNWSDSQSKCYIVKLVKWSENSRLLVNHHTRMELEYVKNDGNFFFFIRFLTHTT